MIFCLEQKVFSDWVELFGVIAAIGTLFFALKQIRLVSKQIQNSATDQINSIKALSALLEESKNQTLRIGDLVSSSEVQTEKLIELLQINLRVTTTILSRSDQDISAKDAMLKSANESRLVEMRPKFARPLQGLVMDTNEDGWKARFINFGNTARISEIKPIEGNESSLLTFDRDTIGHNEVLTVSGKGAIEISTRNDVNHGVAITLFSIIFEDIDGNLYKQDFKAPTGITFQSTISEPERINRDGGENS